MSKNNSQLLTREQFKEQVFKRDKHTCVFCSKPAVDAHHILDRKLFSDGGYYLNNGASVCESHHWEVEKTNISVENVYKACGITDSVLPPQLDKNQSYDKWGNVMLENGMRQPGSMFFEENVQKILKDKLYLFDI